MTVLQLTAVLSVVFVAAGFVIAYFDAKDDDR